MYRRRASSPNEYGNRIGEAYFGHPLQGTAAGGSARRASADASESSVSIEVTVRVSGAVSTTAMWRALRYTAAGTEADGRSVTDLEMANVRLPPSPTSTTGGAAGEESGGTVLGVLSGFGSDVVMEPLETMHHAITGANTPSTVDVPSAVSPSDGRCDRPHYGRTTSSRAVWSRRQANIGPRKSWRAHTRCRRHPRRGDHGSIM